MEELPILIDPVRLPARDHPDPTVVRTRLMDLLGTLTATHLEVDRLGQMRECIGGNTFLLRAWEQAVAEEILLLDGEGACIPEDLLNGFRDVRLFGEENPPLQACLGMGAAAGVFPLRSEPSPGLGHVWVIPGMDLQVRREGAGKLPSGFGVGFVSSHSDFNGDSWQLAAHLALSAIQFGLRRELARDWLVTGAVGNKGRIQRVEVGNKLSIRTRRRWIIPAGNVKDLPPSVGRKVIRNAYDMDSAWAVVSGKGVRRDRTVCEWPADVSEIHVLMGGDIKAALASVLYSSSKAQVHLWHSENKEFSAVPAAALKEIVHWLRPNAVILRHHISSSDMAEAEQSLRNHFLEAKKGAGAVILFNVTSGNRLMSYAAQSMAMQIPNMKLVYRDVDARPHRFTMLDYSERPVTTVDIVGDEAARKMLACESWEWLFTRTPPGKSQKEIVKQFKENLASMASGHGT